MTRAAVLDDWDEAWKDDAVATIIALSHAHDRFTSDDLRREMRPPNRPSQYGAAFQHAQAAGLIEAVGYGQSSVKTRNHGTRRVWTRKKEGVNR